MRVHNQVSDPNHRVLKTRLPPQQRPNSGYKLLKIERLCKIIISAGVQASYAIRYRTPRSEHQNRNRLPAGPQGLAYGESISVRQHEIQHHNVVRIDVSLLSCAGSILSRIHGERVVSESLRQISRSIRFIFYN
jgi:hypothetical protein